MQISTTYYGLPGRKWPLSDALMCWYCGEHCGGLMQGNGAIQCARYGTMWTDTTGMTLTDIARTLGVERATADTWRTRGVLPEPDWSTAEGRPRWEIRTIAEWARDTKRL